MAIHYAVAAASLAFASTGLALGQGLLPGRRRAGRAARTLIQLFLFLLGVFALVIALTAARNPGDLAYRISASVFLGVFVLLDIGREVAFQRRAPFSGAAVATLPSTTAAVLVAFCQLALSVALIVLKAPLRFNGDNCGHADYAFRDAAPFFGAAVYAAWLVHEHIGYNAMVHAMFGRGAKFDAGADEEERDLWVKQKIRVALGAEAALEAMQVVIVVATLLFTCVIAEIVVNRRVRCVGVWRASKFALPLLAACSGVLAARMAAMRACDHLVSNGE